jgi:hypothetical protein
MQAKGSQAGPSESLTEVCALILLRLGKVFSSLLLKLKLRLKPLFRLFEWHFLTSETRPWLPICRYGDEYYARVSKLSDSSYCSSMTLNLLCLIQRSLFRKVSAPYFIQKTYKAPLGELSISDLMRAHYGGCGCRMDFEPVSVRLQ